MCKMQHLYSSAHVMYTLTERLKCEAGFYITNMGIFQVYHLITKLYFHLHCNYVCFDSYFTYTHITQPKFECDLITVSCCYVSNFCDVLSVNVYISYVANWIRRCGSTRYLLEWFWRRKYSTSRLIKIYSNVDTLRVWIARLLVTAYLILT